MRNKILLRIIVFFNCAFTICTLFIGGESLVAYINSSYMLLLLTSSFMLFGTFYLWGCMLLHWGKQNFLEQFKTIWFFILLFIPFLGIYIYYFMVFEKQRTLKK